ncbi:MAG: hypothetical protein DMF61_00725 [Blastocatellia bacterium AA13]|nr:MAG: hypothetical protein DMF61_00725 [Blastocatellia bacterium AA13]
MDQTAKPIVDGSAETGDGRSGFWSKFKSARELITLLSLLVAVSGLTIIFTRLSLDGENGDLRRQNETLKKQLQERPNGPASNDQIGQQVGVSVGQPATVFNGDLKITVTDLRSGDGGDDYRVNATLVRAGMPPIKIKNAKVGYMVTYPEEGGYKITVLAADAQSAKFSIIAPGKQSST